MDEFRAGEHEVEVHPEGICAPADLPESWCERPLARFAWGGYSGDPSVGIGSWYGWCLVEDQKDTVLGEIFNPQHQDLARDALARRAGCNVDAVMAALDEAGFMIVPKVLP